MTATLKNMAELEARFKKTVSSMEAKIVDARKKIAKELVKSLIENIPVWSGRSVRSIEVSNTGGPSNSQETHPDRGDTDFKGKPWFYHPEFGATSQMDVGQEPQRAPSEAVALASVDEADYSLDKTVYIVSNSYMWAEIDKAVAPTQEGARNDAIVSRLAVDKVRGIMKGLVK